jgi:hypothetical protein
MKMIGVESSAIRAIGHDPATDTLAVRFHKSGTYYYAGVSPQTFEEFLFAESVGKFFAVHIKGHYEHAREAA